MVIEMLAVHVIEGFDLVAYLGSRENRGFGQPLRVVNGRLKLNDIGDIGHFALDRSPDVDVVQVKTVGNNPFAFRGQFSAVRVVKPVEILDDARIVIDRRGSPAVVRLFQFPDPVFDGDHLVIPVQGSCRYIGKGIGPVVLLAQRCLPDAFLRCFLRIVHRSLPGTGSASVVSFRWQLPE